VFVEAELGSHILARQGAAQFQGIIRSTQWLCRAAKPTCEYRRVGFASRARGNYI
jgi:hypothetical protein